eukprot:489631_1
MSIYLSEYRLKECAKTIYIRPKFKHLREIPKTNLYTCTTRTPSVKSGTPSVVTKQRVKTIHKKKKYDFVKTVEIEYGESRPAKRIIPFNEYDDPEQIAKEWGAKYIKDEENENNRAAIIDEVTSQIIAINKDEDRIGYVLKKLKILFRINRRQIMDDKSIKMYDNELYRMKYKNLLAALRK